MNIGRPERRSAYRIITLLSVLMIVASCDSASADNTPRGPILVVSEASPASEATLLRVLIQNSGASCSPLYLDRIISAKPIAHRPPTVLMLELIDSEGSLIRPSATVTGTFTGAGPAEMIRLDCGMISGRVIDLESPMWFGTLKPGRYRLRACLLIRTRTFANTTDGWVASLAKFSDQSETYLWSALRDLDVVAEEIEIVVR